MRWRKLKKQPKVQDSPPRPTKTPRTEPFLPPNQRNPVWQFRGIDLDSSCEWGWEKSTREVLKKLVERLSSFELMTWQQIEEGTGSHPIEMEDLCSDARKRLADLKQDDLDELFSLRISGKERVWGIREEHVLRILWWDPEHSVCPSEKKHT